MNVLYLHHVRYLGGSSRSLFELVCELRKSGVQPFLLAPAGEVADYFEESAVPTLRCLGLSEFNNSAVGHYSRFRWLLLLRELAFLLPSLWAILKVKRRWGKRIDLIHANEFPLAPLAVLAKWILRKPLVLHARGLQTTGNSVRSSLLRRLVRRHVDQVVAIDTPVKESIGLARGVAVVHNGQSMPRAVPDVPIHPPQESLRVGIVANFLAYKGIWEFVEAAEQIVNQRGGREVKFIVFGGTFRKAKGLRYRIYRLLGFVDNLEERARAFVEENGLQSNLEFRGYERDLASIYGTIDVLCFPSHLDAVGRPVFEAAFFGVPSIVALRSRRRDEAIIDGETGLIVRERDSAALADAIDFLHRDPDRRRRMGQAARVLAIERFDIRKNALQMLKLYEGLSRSGEGRE